MVEAPACANCWAVPVDADRGEEGDGEAWAEESGAMTVTRTMASEVTNENTGRLYRNPRRRDE